MGALVFLALLGGLAIVQRWEAIKPSAALQAEVTRRPLTANAPGKQILDATISRDGKYLAYSNTAWKMHLLQIDSGNLRQLPSSDFTPLDWFPDGNHLLVSGRGQHSGLWRVSIGDGTSRKLLDSFAWGLQATVSPDGSHIAYLNKTLTEIWLMEADAEKLHRIATFDASDFVASLAWSPGGQRLAYTRFQPLKPEVVIETCNLQGGQRTLVLSEPRLSQATGVSEVYWLPDGRILYRLPDPSSYSDYFDYNIWAIGVDPGSGKPLGQPARVASVAQDPQNFRASTDGRRFTYLSLHRNDAVYLGNLELGAKAFSPRNLTLDGWNNWPWGWTRDSKAVLFTSIRRGRVAILKQRIDQQSPEILLSGAESYRQPAFSPAGDRLLYTMSATAKTYDPTARLMSSPVEGGARSVLLSGQYTYHCGSVPSARCVLLEVKGQELVFSILDPVEGKGAEIQRVEALASTNWDLSPDANKIAIVNPQGGRGEIRVLRLADRSVVTLALQGWKWDQIQSVAWSPDESHLFATAWSGTSNAVVLIDLRGNLQVLAEVPQGEAFLYQPLASPDGHYLAYEKRTYGGTAMMLEHF